MRVEIVREDKYKLKKLQTPLFGGGEQEEKVILVYKSPTFFEFLKTCVARELPIIKEEDYHAYWYRKTGGKKLASFQFIKTKKAVHSALLGRLEEEKARILKERKPAILESLKGKEKELDEFLKNNSAVPPELWFSLKVTEEVRKELLRERSVE